MIPSESQAKERVEMESMEVMSAEAVAVWYGSIDTTQELNSTGNLINTNNKRNEIQLVPSMDDKFEGKKHKRSSFSAMRESAARFLPES